MEAKALEVIESALDLVAPGSPLREGLDSVLAARTGALIAIGASKDIDRICNGGFELDIPFEAERLFELCKMDGAIILSPGADRILRANVHLVPDAQLPTTETGIRHRTAERVSLDTDALVIAISQRRAIISLYRDGHKFILEDIDVLLVKANQALQTLERYRARLDEVSARLTNLEFKDRVTLGHVVTVVQRLETVQRVARELNRYVKQLGVEGRLVRMQADESLRSVEDEYHMLLRDFCVDPRPRKSDAVMHQIGALGQDRLLEGPVVGELLGYPAAPDMLEQHLRSRGYRLLSAIPLLPSPIVHRIVDHFKGLSKVLEASEADLVEVDGVGERRAGAITEGLRRMREHRSL